MRDLECPNCKFMNKVPDDSNDSDYVYTCECSACDTTFGFTVEWYPTYTTFETPCQNEGGEHKWKPIIGAPAEYFKDKFKCSYCDEQRTIKSLT